MKRDPFKLKLGRPIPADWQEGGYLNYDQSSVDPRFHHDNLEGERVPLDRRWLLFPVLAVIVIYILQLTRLQILNFHEYLALAEGNRLRVQHIFAPRGLIVDRYGENLVQNLPSFELVATPLDLPKDEAKLEETVARLSSLFELEKSEVLETLNSANPNAFYPVSLRMNLPREKAVIFTTQAEFFPGFSIQNSPVRNYLDALVFSHILGYTGKLSPEEYERLSPNGYLYSDIIGKEGLEVRYESYLRGKLGERLVEVDAQGNVRRAFQEKPPETGHTLSLNLDAGLQKVLYESLERQLKRHRATKAAAVAIEPSTGGVLAAVSMPGYDNNWFSSGITQEQYETLLSDPDKPLFNRAISGTYPPGSTVKPVFAAGALTEGVITSATKVFDSGRLVVPNQFNPSLSQVFRGWNPSGLGNMDVYSAIAQSSDIFFYTLGGGQAGLEFTGMGPERLAKYLNEFYFGTTLGIDLPGERPGLVPTPAWKAERFADSEIDAHWYLGDTYNMSIGQGFNLATPLQLAVYTAAIANGGKIYQPRLVKSVSDEDGQVIEEFQPRLLTEVSVAPESLKVVREGMRRAVTQGTARSLSALPIAVAGKTGTSQFDSGNLKDTHAWFISFAPFEEPKLAIAVLVEAGGEGSGAAAPVAEDAYRWYAEYRMSE